MPNLDLDLVRHALSVAREHGFAEVELKIGDDSFTACLEGKARQKAVASSPLPETVAHEEPASNGLIDVKAGLVGYFRPAKTPLGTGASIAKGDILGSIAALGISNDVESPAAGEVTEMLVESNQPVEYGQVLARIKP